MMPQFGELSITILEVSFTLINDVYSTGITYDDLSIDDCNMFIVQANSCQCDKTFFHLRRRKSFVAFDTRSAKIT